jgi:hypothetical protein
MPDYLSASWPPLSSEPMGIRLFDMVLGGGKQSLIIRKECKACEEIDLIVPVANSERLVACHL